MHHQASVILVDNLSFIIQSIQHILVHTQPFSPMTLNRARLCCHLPWYVHLLLRYLAAGRCASGAIISGFDFAGYIYFDDIYWIFYFSWIKLTHCFFFHVEYMHNMCLVVRTKVAIVNTLRTYYTTSDVRSYALPRAVVERLVESTPLRVRALTVA